jgi:hypothetical protein
MNPKNRTSTASLLPRVPYSLDIYDDATSEKILSNVRVEGSRYTFPDGLRKNIGVYRIVATDIDGRIGETTLAVRSGPLASIDFVPVSQVIGKNTASLGVLRLLDAHGNIISPTFQKLLLSVE